MSKSNGSHGGFLVTVDVEDHSTGGSRPRFREALGPLLTRLRRDQIAATFFVVGELAELWRAELADLAAEGHEISLHGHTHRFLDRLGEAPFRDELRRGMEAIHSITGESPRGFRAPYFSLTRRTPWAPDAIADAGFAYSSSVLPAWNPQAGLPGAPQRPFLWPSRLVEFPAPITGWNRFGVPVLGGAYLRLAPSWIVNAARRNKRAEGQWTYAHPYDFDEAEPFQRRPGQAWWVTKLLFMRRRLMLPRVLELADESAPTLAELAQREAFRATLSTWSM